MNSKSIFITAFLIGSYSYMTAQQGLKYQLPPAEIINIVDAPPTTRVSVSPDKTSMVLIEQSGILTIKELSGEEYKIAGLRINALTNGPGRISFNKGFKVMNIDGTDLREIRGMPENPRLGSPVWSADGKKIAFTNTTESSVQLWICDITSLTARIVDEDINMVFGDGYSWLSDSMSILYLVCDPGRGIKPERSKVPEGPVVQENMGKGGQVRTYQDLLKDAEDEILFEYYAKSQLMLWDGNTSAKLGTPAIFSDISPSPDGQYIKVTVIDHPFSYIVPYYFFPSSVHILDIEGKLIKTLASNPLVENLPRGYDVVLPGPRSFNWRSDKPASVYWVEALDGGDYSKDMPYHDQVFMVDAPFNKDPGRFVASEMRFNGIIWGNDNYAVMTEGLSKTRIQVVSSFDPSDPQGTKKIIQQYRADDGYNNPGRFLTSPNEFGRSVLLFSDKGRSLFLSGIGSSPEGDRPFLDRYDIQTGQSRRLWRSEAPYFETISSVIDISGGVLLTSRQSVTEVANYFLRNVKNGKLTQVTKFENPYPQLAGIEKRLVEYKRNDSIDLSFMLYLPRGYNKEKDGPLPALLWAYPREFNDPAVAGMVSGSPYTFTTISPASALVYVTQGYAILMDASFPIVGIEGREPNDTYIEQLVADAEAAVKKAVEIGVADPGRIAVSGHSYGAFMTANLLANTRLFAAGIAESGAYNRTLTPFGFQSERRSYWEAPELYYRMSPFMHADNIKDPVLLIHGTADNNEGTFPIQSERFYSALKGFGATTRLVLLPNESHGYSARESILHKHWEVLNWLNKYVKGKKSGID